MSKSQLVKIVEFNCRSRRAPYNGNIYKTIKSPLEACMWAEQAKGWVEAVGEDGTVYGTSEGYSRAKGRIALAIIDDKTGEQVAWVDPFKASKK